MTIFRVILLYFHTIKFLKLSQVIYRIKNKFKKFHPNIYCTYHPKLRSNIKFSKHKLKYLHQISENKLFNFLNQEIESNPDKLWKNTTLQKLWLYNLHYFNDLKCAGSKDWAAQSQQLIYSWIDNNPPFSGVGWEPYPLSIRIVNFVKWQIRFDIQDDKFISSLAIQARYLNSNIEYHIGGNHLLANAKALVFAGSLFEGPEADKWLIKGIKILASELEDQILNDGGHYERSPMYHALVLEDILDLENLIQSNSEIFSGYQNQIEPWPRKIDKMLFWLNSMTHPDGGISFFNDAALGIAMETKYLNRYAEALGHSVIEVPNGIVYLEDSGYIRVAIGTLTLLIDVAPIGPDHLPAHAHADSLSYELSHRKQRIIINSGVSHYDKGTERTFQRGTSAHSTVEVDAENSSEVWHSFRVAKRARVYDISIKKKTNNAIISAKHNGYLRLKKNCVHERTFILNAYSLEIIDKIGGSFSSAVSRHYLHPNLSQIECVKLQKSLKINNISIESNNYDLNLINSSWFPEFGLVVQNKCIEMQITNDNPESKLQIKFAE